MSDEPKENMCNAKFYCETEYDKPCAYRDRADTIVKHCKYRMHSYTGFYCISKVAQTNKMVLLLKDAGFDVTRKGKVENE